MRTTPTEPNIYSIDFFQDGWYVCRNGQPIKGPLPEIEARAALARAEREGGGREVAA